MGKNTLSEKEINQVISNVKVTMEMEGLTMTKDVELLGKKVLKGEIKGNKAIEIIKSKYTSKTV